jgi:hypothetical protein
MTDAAAGRPQGPSANRCAGRRRRPRENRRSMRVGRPRRDARAGSGRQGGSDARCTFARVGQRPGWTRTARRGTEGAAEAGAGQSGPVAERAGCRWPSGLVRSAGGGVGLAAVGAALAPSRCRAATGCHRSMGHARHLAPAPVGDSGIFGCRRSDGVRRAGAERLTGSRFGQVPVERTRPTAPRLLAGEGAWRVGGETGGTMLGPEGTVRPTLTFLRPMRRNGHRRRSGRRPP